MQGIKAFVGHSFSDSDKEIVRIFTDHFENLKKAHGGGFAWDHAEGDNDVEGGDEDCGS